MWNIRMRASKLSDDHKEAKEIHISGAEGIYEEKKISTAILRYLRKAMSHSRGQPDKIFLTIERFKRQPLTVPLLEISSLPCNSPEEARMLITKRLYTLGISNEAIKKAFDILYCASSMRGAALIRMKSGVRAEPDTLRGVRASRLGIDNQSRRRLSMKLLKLGINTERVKEALILASKVAYHKDIIAELCISDNPDYTTGYTASKEFGYMRISNIKNQGHMSGGRVFFIKENSDISSIIKYLEKTPVLVSSIK